MIIVSKATKRHCAGTVVFFCLGGGGSCLQYYACRNGSC